MSAASNSSITGEALATSIGPGLAKAALAIKVDGELRDLAHPIEKDAKVEIVTRTHKDALEVLRHDCAHVMAEAVQSRFPARRSPSGRRSRRLLLRFVRNEKFSTDDFEKIEARMREIVDRNETIRREVW